MSMTKRQKLNYDLIQIESLTKRMRKGVASMGYRSDVAYTIRFSGADDKARQSFYTFLAEAKANEETAGCFTEDNPEIFQVVEPHWTINFHQEYVKWNESFNDVSCHEALLKLAMAWVDDENECIGYFFARIGEDISDIEETFGGNWQSDWVVVSRQLVIDWK
jgi:hypothetical protein